MKIKIAKNHTELGKAAGKAAAVNIRDAIQRKGMANIILATGTSQFETLKQLLEEEIDWSKVTIFHLDEYIGIPVTHPASFRKYLKERFIDKIKDPGSIHYINGENDPEEECKKLGETIIKHPIDVALVGIGENGHLAFNDPPADFDTEEPYLVVELDQDCRRQQLNEGWFKKLDDVPKRAISMSIRQILKAKNIICSTPDKRKAVAVRNSLENIIDNQYPASILQQHPGFSIFIDEGSASLLTIPI